MNTELLKKGIKVGAKAATIGVGAARMKENMSYAVEDQIVAAKRAMKRTRYAAEDCLDETEYRIKQHPFRAVGIVFGLGFGVGLMIGGLVGYKGARRTGCCQ
ncbi:MAG: hypothetical protein JST84_00135 [Acidobacteria bacterium]|nr:hypothetical protein [Acidobacteriota bacterium]